MLNDYLQRVQVGRYKEVPVENLTSLWFVFYDNEGEWDSATMTQWRELLPILIEPDRIVNIFAVWNGVHRTNLFLMNKQDLIERLNKMLKSELNQPQVKRRNSK